MEESDLHLIEQTISYEFKDKNLLQEALRHSSYANEQPDTGLRDNERLEFLGDAVLNLVVGHILMQRNPELKEGELSRLRAGIVNESRLAAFAVAINLGNYIQLGKGELQTLGRKKKSILANAFEALLAAIYLDGGFSAAFQIIEARFADLFETIARPTAIPDFKTRLQELVQQIHSETPTYHLVDENGPDHDKTFTARVAFASLQADGIGKSKKAAEQEAARLALEMLTS
ncbi:MAG: ribonuclease III [Desulfobacterales bacterium]|nr:ribonuclease III [Desulfobacterales bacterium]